MRSTNRLTPSAAMPSPAAMPIVTEVARTPSAPAPVEAKPSEAPAKEPAQESGVDSALKAARERARGRLKR